MPYTLRFPPEAQRLNGLTWPQLVTELKQWAKFPRERQVLVIQALTAFNDLVKLEIRLMWLPRTRPDGFHIYSSWDA